MQRWMMALIVCAVLAAGGLAGAWFVYRGYKDNRPQPMWVELPLKNAVPQAKGDELVAQMKADLTKPEVVQRIARDLGLAAKWKLADETAAGEEVARRVFVKFGTVTNHPMGGNVPALHIGATGKVKERETSGKIAEALMREFAARQAEKVRGLGN